MTTTILQLTAPQVERAERARDLLTKARHEVLHGQRKIPRAIKVEVELSERCQVPGIAGRLVGVSVTGAIFYVKDGATKQVIEVPNREVVHLEVA